LTRERDKLRIELDKAHLVIGVQKKVTALLDLLVADNKPGST
jgi:transposase